jgi:hypothetical protein
MEHAMKTNRGTSMTLLIAALFSVALAVPARAAAPRADVVGEADLQAQIEQRVDREAADRQAIADLLRRPDVRRIAGVAGIDLQRVTAAAGLLSGTDLATVAASANEINTQAGGAEKVTLAVTTIIIILLLIIILAD